MTSLRLKYVLSIAILLAFTLLFSHDLYTLQRVFYHHDIMDTYYPFRNWFTQSLLKGDFPLWNPYWGIGNTTEVWATIPIDIYTPLEFIFGPKYHYFIAIQLGLLMLSGFYGIVKMRLSPLVASAGIILFFMSPLVTYFYFYFIKTNLFAGLVLSFPFIYLWFRTEHPKYLFFLFWSVIFSMFGTKLEFWFGQIVYLVFAVIISGLVCRQRHEVHFFRKSALAVFAIIAGILAHAWQLNLLLRITSNSGRISGGSFTNMFSSEMYQKLLLSVMDSDFLKLLLVGCLVYFSVNGKNIQSRVLIVCAGLLALGFKIWTFPELQYFIISPQMIGVLVGVGLSRLCCKNLLWQGHVKTGVLFLIFIFYWCRPEPGDLEEVKFMRQAPLIFKILLSALSWLGCSRFPRSRLTRIVWFSMLAILIMRVQGLVVLAYLTGFIWIPFRDNFLIDFSVAIMAASGLATLTVRTMNSRFKLADVVACLAIALVILSAWSDLYYAHSPMLYPPPPDYPYYNGVERINEDLRAVRGSPWDRFYSEPYPATFGFESALWEKFGEVTLAASLTPKNYRDWSIYKRLGIIPDDNWRAHYPAFTEKTVSLLPSTNTLEQSREQYYYHMFVNRPPLENKSLSFLGVTHFIIFKSFPWYADNRPLLPKVPEKWFKYHQKRTGKPQSYLNTYRDLDDLIQKHDLEPVRDSDWLYIAKFKNPLPRTFVVYGVTKNNEADFMTSLDGVYEDWKIQTKSSLFEMSPANVLSYEPERVLVKATTDTEGYLVLADLHHPFWHARVDGVETEIVPAFNIYRGIRIPPGDHLVEFYCAVPNFNLCVGISIAMIFGSVLMFKYFCARKKRELRPLFLKS